MEGLLSNLKENEFYRYAEKALLALFIVASVLIIIFSPPEIAAIPTATDPATVEAIASGMPNQGWTPLTVYFSGFGSYSTGGEIVKYEWDLDGNGILDTDATAEGGYAAYTYAKPGDYLVTLQVTDEDGRTDTDSFYVSARHPGSSNVDYWTVFDDTTVGRVTIEMTIENWNKMWSNPEAKIEVPANAIVFGERLDNVGFRMRGQFSLRESGWKKPWKINVDAYITEQEYHNLRQLMFINAIGDSTLIQEKIAYDLMHFAGVPSSHVRFVEMWFDFTDTDEDPVFWGVYTMIERIDRKFIGNRFGQDARDGNLYKASHAQRGPMDLVYYGDSIEDYPTQNGMYAYGKVSNEEENDYSDIVELCRVISGTTYDTPEDFAAAAEEVLNVDGFLRYMAVIGVSANWDSYPYTGNNFYLFNNPVTGRFEWLPWDLTFGGEANMSLFVRGAMNISPYAPLFDNVFKVDRYRRQYAAYLDLLIRNVFNYESMYQRAKTYHDLIAPYVEQGDKMFYSDTAWFDIETFRNSWTELPDFTRRRTEYIIQAIEPYR